MTDHTKTRTVIDSTSSNVTDIEVSFFIPNSQEHAARKTFDTMIEAENFIGRMAPMLRSNCRVTLNHFKTIVYEFKEL